MEKSQNYVELWGTAGAAPSFSHENHGESFYRFPLRVERLSGQSDLPLILAPSTLLEGIDIAEGTPLRVTGQLRSFNNRSGHGSRLVISGRVNVSPGCHRFSSSSQGPSAVAGNAWLISSQAASMTSSSVSLTSTLS